MPGQIIRSAAPVTQNHLSKPTDLMLQNATPLRKSAPWPPNISHEHVFCTAPATENASLQIFFKRCTPAMVFGHATKPLRFAHFWQGAQSLAPATRNDIWTSKCGANMWCFVHFDFEMCFAPQRRALFRHLNFQKWSEHGVFCTFWLRNVLPPQRRALFRHRNFQKWSNTEVFLAFSLTNVLRATTACTFSSLIWPDGSAPAALASLLVDPPEPQIIGKTQCFATFIPFRASAFSFFWLFLFYHLLSSALLFSLPLPSSAFHLSILSEVWLLNFLRQLQLLQQLLLQLQLQLQLRHIRLHYSHYTILHCNCNCNYNYNNNDDNNYITFHSVPSPFHQLHCITLHYSTLQYTALHKYNCNCSCSCYFNYNYITLHYTTISHLHYTARHCNYSYKYNCDYTIYSTPHYFQITGELRHLADT